MGWPRPFGRRRGEGGALSDSRDPLYLQTLETGPVAWPTFTGDSGAEAVRIAKGEPPRGRQEIIDAVHGRPAHQRTPYPVAGQRVDFRRLEWGDLEPATILAVQDPAEDDPNLNINHGQDPMPSVVLQTDAGLVTRTREARVRGAAGWLPR